MKTRRAFLKHTATGAVVVVGMGSRQIASAATPLVPTLDPRSIPKYQTPLVIPPAMPQTRVTADGLPYYEIAARQIRQSILPTSMGKVTNVWAYGSPNHANTFNYPGFSIEATYGKPIFVKWRNELTYTSGWHLPHLLPVDPTLHWANPAGPIDKRPTFTSTPGPYRGPVPLVAHMHGGHTRYDSDGYPEAWFLPKATSLNGYTRKGTRYQSPAGTPNDYLEGAAVYQYDNAQRAATLWYHDHALGLTRLNVYAGLAGFYNLRGGIADFAPGVLPGPAPQQGDPAGKKYYEIPLAIQDRSFNDDGSLFYPNSRQFFGDAGPGELYIPHSELSPIWNPEFIANTMVVNGKTWPAHQTEKRRYRFRLLNGTQARTLILKLVIGNPEARPGIAALPFWLIGSDGGALPAPQQLSQITMAPGERYDVIVDFTSIAAGTDVYLINEGPDAPFTGTVPIEERADPATTGQVMKFHMIPATSTDTSTPPSQLRMPYITAVPAPNKVRQVALFEEMDAQDRPTTIHLGTPTAGPQHWGTTNYERPALGATETWEIFNTTGDAHPIHLHQVMFQVVNRQAFTATQATMHGPITNIVLKGTTQPPTPQETGYKDTAIAPPGMVTRIRAKFDIPNLFVWHCHILDHEDNEMMLPYFVTQNPSVNLGAALGYTLVSFNSGVIRIDGLGSSVTGDVAIARYGRRDIATEAVKGSLFVDAAKSQSDANFLLDWILDRGSGKDMTGALVPRDHTTTVANLTSAATAAVSKAPTAVMGKITSSTTITGKRGVNVIRVDTIELDLKETLTLTGTVDDEFIINVVGGKFRLAGAAAIRLSGGLLPSNVLFQVSSGDVVVIAGSQGTGTILAPKSDVTITLSSSWTGAIYAGGDINVTLGSSVKLVG